MKTERNIFIAFILNLGFSIFEFIGGALTNSVSITSDAIHDMGDAASIGVSFFMERKSKHKADAKHSYGYARYSLIGSAVTTGVLAFGSLFMIKESIERIANPVTVDYRAMIWLAIFGFAVNLIAAVVTRDGDSHNQKAVNLHMLEDVFGWLVVLIGAIVMNFTDFTIIDSAMSIGIAVVILISAVRQFKEVLDIMLDNTPEGISIDKLSAELCDYISNVKEVHHMHIWSTDGTSNYATLHAIIDKKADEVKAKTEIKKFLCEHEIDHTTVEIEREGEICAELSCKCSPKRKSASHHHHGHHH